MKQMTITNPEPVQITELSVLPAEQTVDPGDHITDNADYIGPDGLLYCGKCHTPKEAYTAGWLALHGMEKHHIMCLCDSEEYEKQQAEAKQREHEMTVSRFRSLCFPAAAMQEWTFENSASLSDEMDYLRKYASNWDKVVSKNIGLLLWGSLGTGKTYAAACIANMLLEKEVSVRMTSFPQITNDLFSHENKNEYLNDLCRADLLIIDDFGAERKTDYMLETMWNVLELRSSFRKPLIITTNLTMDTLRDPPDESIARIYDRILAMCAPLLFPGENIRIRQKKETLQNLEDLLSQ